jgi:hypothetical protein
MKPVIFLVLSSAIYCLHELTRNPHATCIEGITNAIMPFNKII